MFACLSSELKLCFGGPLQSPLNNVDLGGNLNKLIWARSRRCQGAQLALFEMLFCCVKLTCEARNKNSCSQFFLLDIRQKMPTFTSISNRRN